LAIFFIGLFGARGIIDALKARDGAVQVMTDGWRSCYCCCCCYCWSL